MVGYSKLDKVLENIFNILNMKKEVFPFAKMVSQNHIEKAEMEKAIRCLIK